jgi:hypothetical protein
VLGHYLRSLWGIFCSTGQAGYKRTNLLKYKVNAGPLDVQRDDPYNWEDEKDDDDDDDGPDERAFWDAVEIEDTEGDSRAAQREEEVLALLDAAALAGLSIGRDFLDAIYEIIGGALFSGIPGAVPSSMIKVLTRALPHAVAAGKTVLEDVDALDLAAVNNSERTTLRGSERTTLRVVLEAIRAARDSRRGGAVTVDPDVLDRAQRLEELFVSAGLLDEDGLLASWAEISIFDKKRAARSFYYAAREAGRVVSREWVIELHEDLSRVDGPNASDTLRSLAHALLDPETQSGALLRDASVLRRALDAVYDVYKRSSCLNPFLKGDRDRDPALDAALTKLEEKGFHTGPIAAYEDVLDPELTELRNELRSACGTTDAKVRAVIDAVNSIDGLFKRPALRLLIASLRDAPGAALAPGQRDALRRAAEEDNTKSVGGVATSNTLKPLLDLLHYSDNDDARLKMKTALITALDEANVHGRSVEVITYDVFIAKDAPAYVTALDEAGKKAGLSFTIKEAEALCDAVGKDDTKEGLDGCAAKRFLEVLAAGLRAGQCNGRILENEEGLAQACIDAGTPGNQLARALKHLLDPLTGEDGPEPTKTKDKKRWKERRVVARRVANLLHDMRIHLRGVPFASYGAVQTAWRVKEDDRKQEAEEAQFNADMDDIDNAEDEEPKVKRPKRSCRTKTQRGGST